MTGRTVIARILIASVFASSSPAVAGNKFWYAKGKWGMGILPLTLNAKCTPNGGLTLQPNALRGNTPFNFSRTAKQVVRAHLAAQVCKRWLSLHNQPLEIV